MPLEFSFTTTELVTIDAPVSAPSGIVYSTNPYKAEAADGKTYFVKGPDLEIVFAELAGCKLAAAVGIPVPPVAVCSADGLLLAGSQKMEQAFRDASVPLKRPEKIVNLEDLYSTIAVDTWLGNTDRNFGNVLAIPFGDDKIELVMIDFEKSATLRQHPRINSTLIEYGKLWPTAELGQRARELKKRDPPMAILQRIAAIDEQRCRELLAPIVSALQGVSWVEDSVGAIVSRGANIRMAVEAVWQST